MFTPGIINDEVSQDIRTVCEFAKRFDVRALEIRSVEGKSLSELTAKDARDIQSVIRDAGLYVASLAAPAFKTKAENAENELRRFRRFAELAEIFECGIIRGFDFEKCGMPAEERAEWLSRAADIAAERGAVYALENDPGLHADTVAEVRNVLDHASSPALKALFDPGNAVYGRENARPYPDDYELIRDDIVHIHVKDVIWQNGKPQMVRVGDGKVDYPGLIRRLIRDGYNGVLSLETHYRKNAALSDEQLRHPGGGGFSDGAHEASAESLLALRGMIEAAQKEG